MTTILDFTPDHVKALHDGEVPSFVEHLGKCGPAFTIVVDEKIVACVGIHVYPWATAGEIWNIFCPDFPKYIYKTYRIMASLLNSSLISLRLKRLQATIRVGEIKHINWVKHFGFHYEGQLEAYGPDGTNYEMWALIPKEIN